ncbi:putative glycine cleavage system H protein [Schistosoma mansoni]|uniref:putative glycine cleavage system H protein n=1 Tax=Schistosoma mansoni TaxID=6183 RepID=UPI0001A61CAB|nr:putative glycine cleavage system H protein [Schistosoma mansoni]|eukprot:XP_018654604.1 putative glycine cleavage system H protein [Schistosoma mansoni]
MEDQCAVVESVKAVSEVYSPVSGTIIEVNSDVEKSTKIINQSPSDEVFLSLTKYENTTTGNYYEAHFDDKDMEVVFQQKPF